MGTLVVHAGMPKAGSSSVQRWLGKQARWLRDTHGLQLISARSGQDPDRPEVAPCPSGSSESDQIGGRLTPAGAKALFDQLDRYLQRRESIVITSESFAAWFYRSKSHVLPELNELAATHPTRVAYYVRPQHTSLEAAWRQWGFREGSKPSDYLRGRMRSLRYFSTVQHVRRTAPNVQFIVRPFRMDLLLGGDVVTDFATTCLGIDDVPPLPPDQWANRGLPLELVNLMRNAPAGSLWSGRNDNSRLTLLRNITATWSVSESPKARRSRDLLQAFCHHEFEPENQRLIRHLGWQTEHFVPPVPTQTEAEAVDLDDLDHLWEPDASQVEQQLLIHALSNLVDAQRPRTHAMTGRQSARRLWSVRSAVLRKLLPGRITTKGSRSTSPDPPVATDDRREGRSPAAASGD
jgi:hypothetical protein